MWFNFSFSRRPLLPLCSVLTIEAGSGQQWSLYVEAVAGILFMERSSWIRFTQYVLPRIE